ncbi:ornithine cyclodeaminase family protein [Psychrobacter sp. ANT_H56B]|uniref:ornithine cyclodeaminase family protein n=1 Tax=Psychrobacter sp. ANT_H56B TaxID=2597353 RepID=UPI0011F2417F|nr:ornithine cyclodeaminase family protein [Psychrobacter sp. ANT_H56B]KAA0926926.1 ornithine cyclodeaminase family protein [Psychrobacter sp. ANT_H56B]
MHILDSKTVKSQLTMTMAIDSIEQLLTLQAQHPEWIKCPERLVIPTFTASDKNSGSHLSMPSVLFDGHEEFAIVKLVTICPDNPKRNLPTTTAVVSVSNNDTGEILAFMDGVYVTQVRTAALSGIASKYLAKPDSQQVSVIGCGGMAYEQLNAVLTVCPNIKTVTLWNRTAKGANTFKTQFSEQYPEWSVTIEVCADIASAVKDADVINLATRATEGLFEINQIKADAHINAVGAYQPEMKEVSDSVIEACSHVFIDDIAGGRHEAGDLIQADAAEGCSWTWEDLSGDLADLVTKNMTIDQDKNGITLFKSVGAASFDAAVALKVAQKAKDEGLGQLITWG